jgi:nitrate/nitrite transporter NarK
VLAAILVLPEFIIVCEQTLDMVCRTLLLLLLLQDLPEGNFRELMASKAKVKDRSPNTLKAALLNYRSWIMCLNYGYCFGVELVVDNVIVYYLVSRVGNVFGDYSQLPAGWWLPCAVLVLPSCTTW